MLTIKPQTQRHTPHYLFVMGITLVCLNSLCGCDDEVPIIEEPAPRTRIVRDALMEVSPFQDYTVAGDTAGNTSGDTSGDTAGDTAGDTSGDTAGIQGGTQTSCSSGEIRLLNDCGVERCLNSEWVREQNSSERCNGHDDDCDGRIDESFSIGGMCFVDDAQGCRLEGSYVCNPNTEAAMCMATSSTSSRAEVCDGVDNDCDQVIDEGFEGEQCCANSSQCGNGGTCVNGMCQAGNPNEPMIDPNATLGTCGRPIWMPSFNIYPADGNSATKELSVINCTGDAFDDGVLFAQTGLGSEVVFAFSLSQTQEVRFTAELGFLEGIIAPVIYAFEGSCSSEQTISAYCDSSIIGFGNEPARPAELIFEARANQLYYVVLDTKLDLLEVAALLTGGNVAGLPFVLNFSAVP